MKTQAKRILEFKKSGIIELNNDQLHRINGGTGNTATTTELTGTGITSTMPCIVTTTLTIDSNGSTFLCDPVGP